MVLSRVAEGNISFINWHNLTCVQWGITEILHQRPSFGFKPQAVSSDPPGPRISEVAKQEIRHPRAKSRKGKLLSNPETVLRTENYGSANGWRLGVSSWEFYICYSVLKLFP